jgi:hypothetical protein
MITIAPVRKQVTVAASQERAFGLFTNETMPSADMRRTDLTAQRKPPIRFSASRSSACENLSRLSRFYCNSRYFESCAAHQFCNADKCARRIVLLEVRAIYGVEFVV